MSGANLLIVEDDEVSRVLLSDFFESEGYTVTVLPDATGCEEQVTEHEIDICLIDVKMPGRDGFSLTRDLRAISNVGIILVTGKDQLTDRVTGLDSGADDYVTKPFELEELASRVKSVLRRIFPDQGARQQLPVHDWVLHLNKRELTGQGGERITLSLGEQRLLRLFIEHAGEVLTRSQLMHYVRNREWHPDDRYIDVLVGHVRRKLRDVSGNRKYITTVHGEGYVFDPGDAGAAD